MTSPLSPAKVDTSTSPPSSFSNLILGSLSPLDRTLDPEVVDLAEAGASAFFSSTSSALVSVSSVVTLVRFAPDLGSPVVSLCGGQSTMPHAHGDVWNYCGVPSSTARESSREVWSLPTLLIGENWAGQMS